MKMTQLLNFRKILELEQQRKSFLYVYDIRISLSVKVIIFL
jgi:hypothetical protein